MRTNAVMSTLSCAQLKPAVAVLANREISNSFRHVSLQRSAQGVTRLVDPTEWQKHRHGETRCTALHWSHGTAALRAGAHWPLVIGTIAGSCAGDVLTRRSRTGDDSKNACRSTTGKSCTSAERCSGCGAERVSGTRA